LLGLFAFGILTKYSIKDNYVWLVALVSVLLIVLLANLPTEYIGGYVFGYELLPLNGLFTFFGLWLIRKRQQAES
ncbi:MAG: sodium:solute symporter, partial [Flavobacteriaceae bacterium]